jgi:prevent-host-death family protein
LLLYFTKNIDIIITAKRERRFIMPNIKPISDLRNYNEVLCSIEEGSPVFLTKNGRGRYVVMDMQDYEKMQAKLKLLTELAKGEKAGQENGWLTIDELEASLGVTNG